MKFQQTVEVTASRAFNSIIDGTKHDYTKVSIKTPMDQSREAVGYVTTDYKYGTHENHAKLEAQLKIAYEKNVPFMCLVDMEIVSTGSKTLTIVHNVTPAQTQAKP